MASILKSPGLVAATASLVVVIAGGTALFHRLEDWTIVESLYFTVATSTTVGYGDLYPTNEASQLAAVVFMLVGTGVLITAVGYIGSFFIEKREEQFIKTVKKKRKR